MIVSSFAAGLSKVLSGLDFNVGSFLNRFISILVDRIGSCLVLRSSAESTMDSNVFVIDGERGSTVGISISWYSMLLDSGSLDAGLVLSLGSNR